MLRWIDDYSRSCVRMSVLGLSGKWAVLHKRVGRGGELRDGSERRGSTAQPQRRGLHRKAGERGYAQIGVYTTERKDDPAEICDNLRSER